MQTEQQQKVSTEANSCCKKNFTQTTSSGRVITAYKTPLDAYNHGEREKLLYTVALPTDETKPDYIVTIDTDPNSKTYSQVIGRLPMPHVGDELHHTGWNACASCKGDLSRKHGYLIVPSMVSGNIYVIDVLSDPHNPKIHAEIPGEEVLKETGGSFPHTTHCLPCGDVMISFMGKEKEQGGGGFLILDGQTFKIKGRWENENREKLNYGYDFWYQPGFNIMVSSEFGEPGSFIKGFDPSAVEKKYGNTLTFWNWDKKTIVDQIELGNTGLIPLELRFPHNPKKNFGYVGAALSSTLIRFYNEEEKWKTEVVAAIDPIRVKGWALEHMPGLITDILISLDDRFLYASLWLHGCVNQYNIEDPSNPRLVGQIYLGGSLQKGGPVMPIDEEGKELPELLHEIPKVKGNTLRGGPLDGQRLFVSSSLLRPWDKQFYPDMAEKGGQIVMVDVNTNEGGLSLNSDFYVNFDNEPFGTAVAHEMRYPGGDCSSDIWI